ncbi:hypothetical protein lbkm_0654 [Lachnospiraceae bacterium KM106-2]|nr:hypothetical protein lbkm_0654 [Lachnospiraceae bacterium KM106-2]
MDKKRSYYAIIPANIRYDNRLNANAKLLYGEITALCNEKGYCWATNDYFAKLYDVSKQSISSWLSRLENTGYIKRNIVYRDGTKEILNRYISLFDDPIQENLKDNNTLINNTSNNKNNVHSSDQNTPKVSKADINDLFERVWKLYPNKKGKGQVSDSKKSNLYKIGYEELERAISRYKKGLAKETWRRPQNGSTFFNSGYVDYLDANYSEEDSNDVRGKDENVHGRELSENDREINKLLGY